jgi:hypothetical protein
VGEHGRAIGRQGGAKLDVVDAMDEPRKRVSPRLDPLRAALARFEAASAPHPKAAPAAKADKRARR